MPASVRRANIAEFFHAVWNDWGARVSGPFSVPFTFLAVFVKDKFQKLVYAALALAALAVTLYRVWAKERNSHCDLQDQVDDKANRQAAFVIARDGLGHLLIEADELMHRRVPDQNSYDQWKADLNSWYRRSDQFITERLSATDAALFRDISQGGRYSTSGCFNAEH